MERKGGIILRPEQLRGEVGKREGKRTTFRAKGYYCFCKTEKEKRGEEGGDYLESA